VERAVVTDILGTPYSSRELDLGTDQEGPITATLVSRRAETPTTAAVLYLHGFVDYFFQTHLADFFVSRGYDFYALDLRKYGRSLRPHQTPNFCLDLREYYEEIDAAVRIIRDEDEHDRLLINGHSTGGLLASLWAHDRRFDSVVDALILNSPFLDLNATWALRTFVTPMAVQLGRLSPMADLKLGLNEVYGRSIHHQHHGEWDYDLTWKPLRPFPVRAGWLRAIREGHHRVHRGLDIAAPVLVAASTTSYKSARWAAVARESDSVLDVDQIARWTPALGRHTTLVRIPGGMHDLTLSAQTARDQLFAESARWMTAYFPPVTTPDPIHPATKTDQPRHGAA
jgi:alpha-beta hydrolase superfamily lysophospholipase